jgi:hypothetical protein
MPEYDDAPVREAFALFRSESLAESPGPDAAGVRRIARRRRTARLAAVAAVAAVAVATPLAAYGLTANRAAEPPAKQPPTTAPASGPPSSGSPSPSPSTTTVPSPPVTRDEVTRATLTVPAWGAGAISSCPQGRVDLTKPNTDTTPRVGVVDFVPADVDHDGDLEAVVSLFCGWQGGDFQVLAIGRDGGGDLVTLGRLVATGEREPVRTVIDLRAETDGDVGVLVGDITMCCGTDPRTAEQQWRTFRWTGTGFAQVAGQTEFHAAAPGTDLTVTMTPLRMGAPVNGVRHGTTTVTVTNRGPNNAAGVLLDVRATRYPRIAAQVTIAVSAGGCATTEVKDDSGSVAGLMASCHLPALGPGESRTYTVEVGSPVANDTASPGGVVAAIDVNAEQPGIRLLHDTNSVDNQVDQVLTTG